ncbi:N-acetylmuramoyl-L-alanine amidase [Streptomyces sp. PTM05]|uniref:N-acetylmuramoyl-L-alanine amidase n=1 Tax=Streptantibioticus parmotrematis TaxID=2873249 RepID=A0ABS7QQS5_9ACTN|nr:N-acetylmuramoyl-L-alanine amidase [Streptantibioticus parmotrematis]
MAGPATAHAAPAHPAHPAGIGGSSALQGDFAAASRAFHVPLPVLLAVSYQESRWDGHAGQYNTGAGYGPMDLTDATAAMVTGSGAGAAGRADTAAMVSAPALHTLDAAARLVHATPAALRDGTAANIRGGAALLASYQKALTGSAPADPADWYGAVARYSQAGDEQGARDFADAVYAVMASGAQRTTQDGQRVRLTAEPRLVPHRRDVPGLRATAPKDTAADCPAAMHCSVVPAAPEGYQQANRPKDGLAIRYIVIHDTESTYEQAIAAFQDPAGGVAANYVMRSSDGAVTQMVPDADLAFHAGNYWFNMHSVGIEHEGFAASGATWYTEAQYRATAELVKYLAARYGIPLDRQHVIGHENVPGPQSAGVAGMHWDPGPYWDWTHFMRLLGVPVPEGGSGVGPVGTAVTITPDFAHNFQTVEVCGQPTGEVRPKGGKDRPTPSTPPKGGRKQPTSGTHPTKGGKHQAAEPPCTSQTQPSDFLYLRTAPSPTAPLYADPALHPGAAAGTDHIDDWGDTVTEGQQFVVAARQGDWTAIWYSGAELWFDNPRGEDTTPAPDAVLVTPKTSSAPAPVYGEAYPQPSEYPEGLKPSTQAPLSMYAVPAGQAYVASPVPSRSDDFFTSPPDTVVNGSECYYTVQYDHRLALLNAADVTVRRR